MKRVYLFIVTEIYTLLCSWAKAFYLQIRVSNNRLSVSKQTMHLYDILHRIITVVFVGMGIGDCANERHLCGGSKDVVG